MNILVIAGDGIGGTEKAAFLLAGELARRGHRVIAQAGEGKPRVAEFLEAGGQIEQFAYTAQSIESTLRKHSIHVIHHHVSGYGDHRELYNALDKMGDSRPRLIETNVFGHLLDFHEKNHVDFRMFISLTSGLQAFQRTRIKGVIPDPKHDTVVFYPMDPRDIAANETTPQDFRDELGVRADECLVIRIGRPSHKWTYWECEAFAYVRKLDNKLKMLLMEPDEPIREKILSGAYGEGFIIKEATSDQAYLRSVYQAADLMLHASRFGESFGYTVAEAMVAELPVITRATPWGDNAQTELVKHNETGYLCGSVKGMSKALLDLSSEKERCKKMGQAGRSRILKMTSLDSETNLLEEILRHITGSPQGPLMRHRYKVWEQYFNRDYKVESIARFERDRGYYLDYLAGNVLDKVRSLNVFKRYLRLKKAGRPVAAPKWL